MNKKSFFSAVGMLILSVAAVIFIKQSNNHNECTTKTETIICKNETKIETTKHICNERFNF